MKQKSGFELRTVCGENIIVATGIENIDFSRLISLNETAAYLWNEAEKLGDFTADDLVEALRREYEVGIEQAQTDVSEMLAEWQRLGIVEA